MAYFEDLTAYSYFPGEPKVKNIGWLSIEHDYKRGPVPLGFVDELVRFLSKDLDAVTRGRHVCEFCKPPQEIIESDQNYIEVWEYFRCGNGEIRVIGENGTTYSAPALLLHYIAEHQYQPPAEFVEAVLYQRSIRAI
ncbi:MAG: hypothetical protein R3F19_04110 [Verrucomicrobiales bacterium]